jgi:hypothetical protein
MVLCTEGVSSMWQTTAEGLLVSWPRETRQVFPSNEENSEMVMENPDTAKDSVFEVKRYGPTGLTPYRFCHRWCCMQLSYVHGDLADNL